MSGLGPSIQVIFLCPRNKSLALNKSYLGIARGGRMIFFPLSVYFTGFTLISKKLHPELAIIW